jgi:hypothetical protein
MIYAKYIIENNYYPEYVKDFCKSIGKRKTICRKFNKKKKNLNK